MSSPSGRITQGGARRSDTSTPSSSRAIADPKRERHAELSEWIGDDFDPNAFDVDEPAKALAALAKRWPRTPVSGQFGGYLITGGVLCEC